VYRPELHQGVQRRYGQVHLKAVSIEHKILRNSWLDLKSPHIETCAWAAAEGRRGKRVWKAWIRPAHSRTTVTSKPVGILLGRPETAGVHVTSPRG